MANTYVITGITHLGDLATVTGNVNGISVVLSCSWSAITGQVNTATVQAFLAPLMLAAAGLSATAVSTYDSTWSQ